MLKWTVLILIGSFVIFFPSLLSSFLFFFFNQSKRHLNLQVSFGPCYLFSIFSNLVVFAIKITASFVIVYWLTVFNSCCTQQVNACLHAVDFLWNFAASSAKWINTSTVCFATCRSMIKLFVEGKTEAADSQVHSKTPNRINSIFKARRTLI